MPITSANTIAHRRQFDRRRKQRQELLQHRGLRDDRLAQVAVQHAADVDAVLHQHRPVQAVFLEQRGVPRRVDAALAGQGLDRIARHQSNQQECHQRHAQKDGHDQAQAGQDEAQQDGAIGSAGAVRTLAHRGGATAGQEGSGRCSATQNAPSLQQRHRPVATRPDPAAPHDVPVPDAPAWFASRGWTPFAFQRQVWAAMAAGESGLLHATTGSGKTYAVWLGALRVPPRWGCRWPGEARRHWASCGSRRCARWPPTPRARCGLPLPDTGARMDRRPAHRRHRRRRTRAAGPAAADGAGDDARVAERCC